MPEISLDVAALNERMRISTLAPLRTDSVCVLTEGIHPPTSTNISCPSSLGIFTRESRIKPSSTGDLRRSIRCQSISGNGRMPRTT